MGAVAAQIDVDGIILEATGPGAWGNALEVDVTHPAEDDPDSLDVAAAQGVPVSELFTLVVREGSGRDVPTETYLNVTAGGGPRPLDLVLAGSTLVQVDAGVPGSRPAAGTYAVAGLDVGGLALRAPDASAWAGALEAKVEHPTGTDANDAATEQDVDVADLFTLILTTDPLSETAAPVSETHAFVTVVDGPTTRRVDDVLAAESATGAGRRSPAAGQAGCADRQVLGGGAGRRRGRSRGERLPRVGRAQDRDAGAAQGGSVQPPVHPATHAGPKSRGLGVGRGRWVLHAAAGLPPRRRAARRRADDDHVGLSPPRR